MNDNSGELFTSGELISSGEVAESGNEYETEEVVMTDLEKDLLAMENAQNGGNLNIMIFTIVICVVFGIILGILSGKKSANK